MDDDSKFYGMPAEIVLGVGKVTIAAGHLERTMHDIGHALSLDPTMLQVGALKRAIDRRLDDSLPSWTRSTTAQQIRDWLARSMGAFDERNTLLHAAMLKQAGPDGWAPARYHIRGASMEPLSAEGLTEVANRIKSLADEAGDLELGLLPNPKANIYVRRPRSRNGPWIVIHGDGDGYPERPTEAEAQAWWERYSPDWGEMPQSYRDS